MSKILTFGDYHSIRQTMQSSRDPLVQGWRRQSKLLAPERFVDTLPSQRSRGRQSTRDILRNEGGMALRTFVSGMMNGATSRARPWYDLVLVDDSKKSTASDRYLAQCVRILNQHLQISNFYRVLPMSYKDIGIFSNSAYAMLPHAKYGFYFLPFAVGTYAIGTDSEGAVNQFSRDFVMTVKQVVEQYGKLKPNGHIDWSNFDPWVQMSWEKANYTLDLTLNNLIIPNADPNPNSLMSSESMNFQSYTAVNSIGSNANSMFESGFRYSNNKNAPVKMYPDRADFISVKGYEYFPVIVNRWEVAPEGDWGVDGPGHLAIEDILSLQETEKYRLEGVAKLVKPPMVGPASLRRHQSSILAGGITYVDEASEGTKFRAAFEVDPQLSELIACQVDYVRAIKKAFFEDLFLMMAQDKPTSHTTAREIEERAAEKLIGIGPAMGQLDHDQNGPVVRNAFFLLAKSGKLPPAPKEIQGADVRPEYISILAQAAKASMIGSTDKLIAFVGALAQVTGSLTITKILKEDKIVRQMADFLGNSPELIRDESEYEDIVEGVKQQQQQQLQAQQMQMASETTKNLASAEVTDTNMLGRMGRQQQQQ